MINRDVSNKRLLALAELLESLPKKRFDYRVFGSVEPGVEGGRDALCESNECGTTACALGWAPSLPFAQRLGIKLQTYGFGHADFVREKVCLAPEEVSRLIFGIDEAAHQFLFYPDTTLGSLRSPPDNASAKRVAKHIRNFVTIRSA